MDVQTRNIVEEFQVLCVFKGFYKEPMVVINVPMELLFETGQLDLALRLNVNSRVVTRVDILDASSNEFLRQASFITADNQI